MNKEAIISQSHKDKQNKVKPMTNSTNKGILGIDLKMSRANEHFAKIIALNDNFKRVECKITFTEDHEKGIGYFVINLPKPPLEISGLVGDCVHNLRTVLDYLVWQMVISNPPNKPKKRNMFPICNSLGEFESQLKGNRLLGVPDTAIEIIKQFQPFDTPHHPLAFLNELDNADKHRDPHYTIAVATDLDISYIRDGEVFLRTIIGNDEVKDGAILGNVGIRLNMVKSQPKVQINSEARGFIAFENYESKWEDAIGVVETIYSIRDFMGDEVIPSLEPFIKQ